MRMLKLSFVLIATNLFISSCEGDLDDVISRRNLPMGGNQEVPAKTVPGTGSIDIDYNQTTKTLYYTVRWSGLTGPITGFHIHASAFKGNNANIFQNFSGYTTATTGTYSGSLLIDNVALKEDDLLRGGAYINIHTQANPGGEIRGQIEF